MTRNYTLHIEFTNTICSQYFLTGAAVVVYFDLSVEFRTMTGCDDIFDDVSGLGTGAQCFAIGTKVLVVLFGKYSGTTLLVPGMFWSNNNSLHGTVPMHVLSHSLVHIVNETCSC